MKQLLFAVSAGLLLFSGCKENHSLVNIVPTPIQSAGDTTYVLTTIPAAEPHNVLAEEFTGQTCSNCPAAHSALEALETNHSGRINTICLYFYGNPQCVPVAGSAHDLRDSTASLLANNVFGGISGIPVGGIDRVPGINIPPLQIYSAGWGDAINTRLTITDSINLKVESTFDNATNTAGIKATVTYLLPVSTPQNITVVVVEDSITDKQEFPSSVEDNYLFSNVFRGMVTAAPFGNTLQVGGSDVKEAGRLFQRVFTYHPRTTTPAIIPQHCRVIAFVNSSNGSDYHILQSVQCKLVP